jgi:transposase
MPLSDQAMALLQSLQNKLKQFGHTCIRFDRNALNYLAMTKLASIRLWLRHYESAA